MDNLAADFEINPNNPLNAEYELDEGVGFDCSFELYASGTVWGSIDGDINNQTDLINLLNTKVDLTSFEELSQTVTNNYNELTGDIADLTTTVTDNYNTLSGQISDLTTTVNDNYTSLDNRLTTAEGSILNLTDTVNDNYTELDGKIITTNNNLSTLSQTVEDNNTAINNRVDGIVDSFDGDISDLNNAIDNLSDTVANNYTELNGKITVNTDNITTIQNTINSYGDIVTYNAAYFATANQGALADTALQPNDNISELVNDVGYITSASLPTVNNATITIQKNGADVGTFTLNQANNDTLNITVPTQASDIGAMPDTTTIEDLTTTAQLNALNSGATTTNIGQITTNQSNIADIRALIPLQASTSNQLADKSFVNSSISTNTAYFIGTFNSVAELEAYSGPLTNNDYAFVATTDSAGNTLYDRYKYNADIQQWIFEYELNNSSFTAQQWASINSGITSGDVTLIGTALQPNDNISELTNDAGYITSASLPTNYVTINTAQDISGRKTFLGEKAIYFKQSSTSDRLGFTLYDTANKEVGGLEYRPNAIDGKAMLAINCPASSGSTAVGGNYVGFRYWSTINIIAPRPSNGNYFIPVKFTDGTNTVTANNKGTLNISSLLPDISDMATQTWVTNQGYTTNVGTVTSVNNTQPDASGNVTLTIPDTATWGNITGTLSNQTDLQNALNSKYDASNPNGYITSADLPTVDQTFDSTSANAQSGVAINGELASNYQTKLVSGTNIKTINNTSLLGSGNISLAEDDTTISKNSDDELQTIGVIDDNVQNAYNFTVVGSPTITDDGIASGFSNNNYMTGSHSNITPTSSIELNCRVTLNSIPNATERIWSSQNDANFFLSARADGSLGVRIKETSYDTGVSMAAGHFVLGEHVDIYVKITTTNLYFKTITQQGFIQERNITVSNPFTALSSFRFGIGGTYIGNSFTTGSIDLKQFSITVDGIEVYRAWQPPTLKYWTGTKAQYDAIVTKDANALYNVEGIGLYKGTTLISNDGADNTLSNVSSIDSNSAVQTALDAKVNKAGDTMTGDLRIRKSYPVFKAENTDIRRGQTPSADYYGNTFMFTDIDGNGMGSLSQTYFTSGKHTTRLWQRGVNSDVYSVLDVGMDENDVPYCSFPNTYRCDGQFVNTNTTIASNVSVNGSSPLTYTLNLPDDGHRYTVWITVQANTNTTSGSYILAQLSSDSSSGLVAARAITRTTSNAQAGGSVCIVVSPTHKIYLIRNTGWNGTVNLSMVGYRRIGTNS